MYIVSFSAANQYSKIASVFAKIQKIVQNLRVNETEVTWRKAFTANPFALENKKIPKMTKGPSLETAPIFLACLLTHRPQMPRMRGFPDCFSFSVFLTVPLTFRT